jgi:hypothetical protein
MSDPYLNSLAFRLLAHTTEEESRSYQAPQSAWDKRLHHQLGGLLVTLGQRMQTNGALFEDIACPASEDEMHLSR